MTAKAEMIGKTFGRLTVTGGPRLFTSSSRRRLLKYSCVCLCGEQKEVFGEHLRSGKTISCGCYRTEITAANFTKHGQGRVGLARTPEYRTWAAMNSRCRNPNGKDYKYYGARGIVVCKKWRESFEAFFSDMGLKPSPTHSIDRKNTNGNYTPKNCRWATTTEQHSNRRSRAEVRAQQHGVV